MAKREAGTGIEPAWQPLQRMRLAIRSHPAPEQTSPKAVSNPERFRALVAAVILFGPPSVLMGMVTPFAVRLSAKEIATVGSASGRLSALSTAGSILGTFATAFFLIPAFATRPILFGLGATLLMASLLVPAPRPAAPLASVPAWRG